MDIIFNADDFGLTRGVTDGIVEAHTKGVVRSTTLMMNGLDVNYAVARAKENPNLRVGIHLTLTWGQPLRNDVKELIDEEGNFKFKSVFTPDLKPDLKALKREWQTQIEAFLESGLTLDHIDSHHHVHGWPYLKELIIELSEQYKVPVRAVESLSDRKDLWLTEALSTDFYAEGVTHDFLNKLDNIDVKSIEIMTHPAIIDDDLRAVSSYVDQRKLELEILSNLKLPDKFNLL